MTPEEMGIAAIVGAGLAVFIIGAIIGIIILVLFLLNLQNLMKSIKEENRDVSPGKVWLMLIPIFSAIYAFILYPKISSSIKKELESRGMEGDGAKQVGLAAAITSAISLIPIGSQSLISLLSLIALIIWWVKTAQYKKQFR